MFTTSLGPSGGGWRLVWWRPSSGTFFVGSRDNRGIIPVVVQKGGECGGV